MEDIKYEIVSYSYFVVYNKDGIQKSIARGIQTKTAKIKSLYYLLYDHKFLREVNQNSSLHWHIPYKIYRVLVLTRFCVTSELETTSAYIRSRQRA